MTRRPLPVIQLSLDLNSPPPEAVIPDEVVQALADLLLEAVGARSGVEQRGDGHEHQDHR